MAELPPRSLVNGLRCYAPLLFTLLALPAAAQIRLPLDQLNSRKSPDYSPAYQGQRVAVRGVVSAPAFHFPAYTVLAIQDGTGGGLLSSLGPDARLDGFHPGDEIEAVGTVSAVSGMPTLKIETVALEGRNAPPKPEVHKEQQLEGFQYLGRLVQTDARVKDISETTSGSLIVLNGGYEAFIPHAQEQPGADLTAFEKGDVVEISGIASQYCPRPPYNHNFEILAAGPSSIVRRQRSWSLPPLALACALAIILLPGFFLWSRERRLRSQRERLRKTYQLGEEILGASSAEAILKRISEVLPSILGVTRVHLFVHNRGTKTLEGIVGSNEEPVSISVTSPPTGTHSGAVACFNYRTLLVIPDIGRSPFPIAGNPNEKTPKSLLFIPMVAQGEIIGVMELDQDDRVRDFTADEQALAQHLGNQIGAAIRLLDQRSVQEQLSRTEKLAAVGRLISGVVNELQTPLEAITELANLASEKEQLGPAKREVEAIANEAKKASAMVARLVSFAAAEQVEARAVSISALLRSLIDFREGDWKASGIRVRETVSREPLYVLGSQGQLEQVFLNLLVHAEQALVDAPQKTISIGTTVLAKRLLVEISFTAPPGTQKAGDAAAILGVTRSVVAGHGGEVRLVEKTNTDPRFEVELPLTAKERVGAAAPAPAGTPREQPGRRIALVIEQDEPTQRQLVALLSARGYRVVPAANADNGLELSHRMRFDAAFCSVHAPGLNWVELSERMHSRVGSFILLSEGYNAELSADFEGEGRFVLPKPIQEAELDRVLQGNESNGPNSGGQNPGGSNKVVTIRNMLA